MKPFVPRMSVQILGISLSSSLRCYPPRFGLQLVQMFHDLISEKAGMPKLPEVVPSAAETFGSMSFDDDVWTEADMVSVCHYLRAGKHLRIPPAFLGLLPTRL